MLDNVLLNCEVEISLNVKLWITSEKTGLVQLPDIAGQICADDCNNHGTCDGGR